MSALNCTAISAVAKRQLHSLLGNPLGYVFILAFVLAAGATLFVFGGDKYFARNIADLGPLHAWMPWFLAVLLPALAMGAWASERESGTEELLLTFPLSIADAILGKWLAVVAYFSLALVCSLSLVAVVAWLGTPDYGLILSNYLGWWLAGLAAAALGVLGSVVVGMPAIAFVVGTVFSGIALWAAQSADWFDPFNRGVVPLGHVGAAIALVLAALGTAVFILASRRWRPASRGTVIAQVLSLTFGLLLLANVARLAHRAGADADVTAEGLASISATSKSVLDQVSDQVVITAFISQELPPELALKGKEVTDKLKALERARPGVIRVDLYRPADALDKAGALAAKEFNLKPRKMPVESAAGREYAEIFLGAAVTSTGKTQLIDHFDPGLSVEYELVRAVRSVAAAKKKILGITSTDLDINGGFDYASGQMNPGWEIVNEWKKQYEVREVNLDSAVPSEVEVLVVPQPSTLTQPQIENLHAAVWGGLPTLIFEDPMPFFSLGQGRADLLPGQPKKSAQQNPMGGGPDENAPKKGDITKLWRALGLDFDESQVVWSDYNPSHQFRQLIPPSFVWTSRDKQGVKEHEATKGISSLLLPFPGQIRVAKDKPAAITVTPLISPTPNADWGANGSSELTERDWMGRMSLKDPKNRVAGDRTNLPALAVAVSGTMKAAYPVADPDPKPVDKDGKKEEPAKKDGIDSKKPVSVVVIADVDFVNNEFFQFYRNQGNRFGEDELRFLLDLRNVQLAANAVDALFAEKSFLDLRNRRPEKRPLTRLEDQLLKTQERLRAAVTAAQSEEEVAVAKANDTFQAEQRKIDERTDLDDNAKAHEKAQSQVREQRKLDLALAQVKQKTEEKVRDAKIEQRRAIQGYRDGVKWMAIGIPAAILALLVVAVWFNRLRTERAHVPSSRRRVG